MRTKLLGTAGWVLGLAATAAAQQPGSPYPALNPQNVMPNVFNPRTQPLSPYLNLLRGGNPGVNYYYGVRPGTVGGGAAFGAGSMAPGGARPTSFPFQYTEEDALLLPEPGTGYALPPAGHPTVFNNTLGYYPGGPGGQRPRPGVMGASQQRTGGAAQQRTGVRR
ncbi:hypothetical protein J0H58_35850 [bacterium]|nr:hypothetical protein [bacterium]